MALLPPPPLRSPFGQLGSDLTDLELRETAYEILVGACRSTGGKPLTYISHSDRPKERTLTSAAASKMKKALGIRKDLTKPVGDPKTAAEVLRVQMGISEQADSRIRRAFLRIAAGQLGRRVESMVLPIEFLQQYKASDFSDQQEYEAWQARHLKILEAGLILHPHLPLDKTDDSTQRVREIIHKALECPLETGKNSESLLLLRNGVMSLAGRSFDGSTPETYHWADGFPLNIFLYQKLLEACFDNHRGSMMEEIDEMLELIKKTWSVLGINQMLHNICFMWVLFHQFSLTGYKEDSLLLASDSQMSLVAKDAKTTKDPIYTKILYSSMSSLLSWTEKQLLAYHEVFHLNNLDLMECVVSLAVSAAKVLEEDISLDYHMKKRVTTDIARDRVDAYIRSSLRSAFTQKMERARSDGDNAKGREAQNPILSVLASGTRDLALKEKEVFSPVLKKWHPLATSVAVVTLHSCFRIELKQFIMGVTELTLDSAKVLQAADKLEKDLVEIAVDASVDSDDGGKAIIQEMPPYEAESILSNLAITWIKTRMVRVKEWVSRNLQHEVWKANANKENVAPSSIEILRMVDDALEAFFQLPIPMHAALVPDLVKGLDESVQHYISAVKSGCGFRNTYIPNLPMLTRCSVSTKFQGVWKKKEKSSNIEKRKPPVGTASMNDSLSLRQLCVRLNTIHHMRSALDNLEKKIVGYSKKMHTSQFVLTNDVDNKFTSSISSCQEGIHQLCEAIAYKTMFCDLRHVLWDGLYVGDVESSRIEFLLQELDQTLEIISKSLHDKVRNRAITATMKASFDGFSLVLLAGGPSRAFSCQDCQIFEEDFLYLKELFLADGDGIPQEVVDKAAAQIINILPLFRTDTERLIEQFKQMVMEACGPDAKSKLPLPPTTGRWSPTDPDTILRVLCYRNDEVASKFLKKIYNLPKRL